MSGDVDTGLASALAALGDETFGTLVSFTVRKKGTVRGKAGSKAVYGDDTVHVLMWAGFNYRTLVERSQQKLGQLRSAAGFVERIIVAAGGGHVITAADVDEAANALAKGLQHSLDVVPTDPDARWKPLIVDGKKVIGARVYDGPANAINPRAPVPGTIYVDGILLGQRILRPALNGAWHADSKPVTIAKDAIRSLLPVSLYVSYCLEADRRVSDPKVGQEAIEDASAAGIAVDPTRVLTFLGGAA